MVSIAMPLLDARYLLCPLPVIRVSERVTSLASGEILTIVCTDRGALFDIPAWCRLEGHEVVQVEAEASGEISLSIRVR